MNDFDKITFGNVLDMEDTEFIPILSAGDEEEFSSEKIPDVISILPLRNTVLFPGVVIPITIGRAKSVQLINDAYGSSKIIGVVAQKDHKIEHPTLEQLNKVGTIAYIVKVLKMPDGNTTVIIQGKRRFELEELTQMNPYIKAKIELFAENTKTPQNKEFKALIDSLKDLALQIIKHSPHIPTEAGFAIKNIENASFLVNFISSNLNVEVVDKQKMLEISDLEERATTLLGYLTKELQMLELKNEIQSKVSYDLNKQQKEYFLNQQMKQIQQELGGDPVEQEINELRKKSKSKKWGKEVAEAFAKDVDKLQRMNPAVAEHAVQMNYLETLLELPKEVLPTPGGPTKQRIGDFISPFNFNTARCSNILSFTFSKP